MTNDSTGSNAPALELRNVSRRYGRAPVLSEVSLSVRRGAALGLAGPNGAGKTTLLRLSTTLLRPSAGTVRVFGLDPDRDGMAIRRRIGLLTHESFLYADLSPLENLLFYGRLYGVAEVAVRVEELLGALDLEGWRNRPLRQLSRGTAQRCALARALLHRPDLLILDEPFTGLDIESSHKLVELLREEHSHGTTLVMTTHAADQMLAVCGEAAILSRGRLVWNGSLVGQSPAAFEEMYVGLTGHRTRAAVYGSAEVR